MICNAQDSLLLVIDVQERLAPAVEDRGQVVQRIELLLRAAERLGVPRIASQQNPDGLGITLAVLCEYLPPETRFGKISFSAWGEPDLRAAITASGRSKVVICGMETHVCVLQTALDLMENGFQVYVPEDACGSRRNSEWRAGLERLRTRGAEIVSSEMVVFEWLGRSDNPAFRDMLKLIK